MYSLFQIFTRQYVILSDINRVHGNNHTMHNNFVFNFQPCGKAAMAVQPTNESNYKSLIVCKLTMTNRMLSISGSLVGNLSDFEVMYLRPNWLIWSTVVSLNPTNYRRNNYL